jgi:hypothetical protein
MGAPKIRWEPAGRLAASRAWGDCVAIDKANWDERASAHPGIKK